MIVFIYKNIVIGGVHTLLLRISKCLLQRGYPLCIYCNSISPDIVNHYYDNKIPIIIYSKDLKYVISEVDTKDSYLIVFEFDLYLDLSLRTRKYKNSMVFLYSVFTKIIFTKSISTKA